MSQVVLYGTRFCPFCTAARRLLTAKGINYQDIALDNDPALRASNGQKLEKYSPADLGGRCTCGRLYRPATARGRWTSRQADNHRG